jgi:hypothetical protein
LALGATHIPTSYPETRINRRVRIAVALLPFAATLLGAQKPLVLSKPDAEHTEPFSQIMGIRELRDGRVIVSDSRDKLVQVIDFRTGATRIGREGPGPGEYLAPGPIVALPGDSSAMWDGLNRRYLLFTPDAKPGKDFRLEPPEGLPRGGYGAFAATVPRGMDSKGNIYFEGSPFVQDAEGVMAPADTVPVLMFNRAAQRPETLAYFHPQKGAASVKAGPGGRGLNISNGLGNPLIPRDEWTALPDGRVVVVRAENYRVDIYFARKIAVAGAPIAHEKIRVDEDVKSEILTARKTQFNQMSPRSGPNGQVNQVPDDVRAKLMAEMMNVEPWPEFVPPFMRNAVLARSVANTSQVWVLRSKRLRKDLTFYDVFDASSKLIGRVQFPANVRVLGFGAGTVYAIRSDEDDLQYLQRYRLATEARLSG